MNFLEYCEKNVYDTLGFTKTDIELVRNLFKGNKEQFGLIFIHSVDFAQNATNNESFLDFLSTEFLEFFSMQVVYKSFELPLAKKMPQEESNKLLKNESFQEEFNKLLKNKSFWYFFSMSVVYKSFEFSLAKKMPQEEFSKIQAEEFLDILEAVRLYSMISVESCQNDIKKFYEELYMEKIAPLNPFFNIIILVGYTLASLFIRYKLEKQAFL